MPVFLRKICLRIFITLALGRLFNVIHVIGCSNHSLWCQVSAPSSEYRINMQNLNVVRSRFSMVLVVQLKAIHKIIFLGKIRLSNLITGCSLESKVK